MGTLEEYRAEIDHLDAQLIDIVARRLHVCCRVAEYKRAHGLPVLQPERATQVVERAIAQGTAHGLDERFVRALYELIMAEACRLEDEIVEDGRA
jgi:chorismate mutase-like protein